MKKIFLILLMLMPFFSVFSQDTIVLNSGATILGNVVQIKTDSVIYTIDGVKNRNFWVEASSVKEIKFGKLDISEYETDTVLTSKSALKMCFMAPVLGHFYLNYERSIADKVTFDVYLGAILEYRNLYRLDDINGGYGRLGFRFYLNNRSKIEGEKSYNPFYGFYLNLLFSYIYFDYKSTSYQWDPLLYTNNSTISKGVFRSFSVNWLYGFQWPVSKHVVFDLSGGFGYSYSHESGAEFPMQIKYIDDRVYDNSLGLIGLIKFGYIF